MKPKPMQLYSMPPRLKNYYSSSRIRSLRSQNLSSKDRTSLEGAIRRLSISRLIKHNCRPQLNVSYRTCITVVIALIYGCFLVSCPCSLMRERTENSAYSDRCDSWDMLKDVCHVKTRDPPTTHRSYHPQPVRIFASYPQRYISHL